MEHKRVLLLTGGNLSRQFVRDYLKKEKFDTIIAVDSGLAAAKELNLQIQYIVGDFDSVPKDVIDYYRNIIEGGTYEDVRNRKSSSSSITIKEYNPVKDATDTHIAIDLCMELDADEIVLLGATGSRVDHMLANIYLLNLPLSRNKKAYIIDEHNKIYLINQNTVIYKEKLHGPYVSLIPFTETVKAVTLQGFKYPLNKRDLRKADSLGISNEVTDNKADILLETGILMVIEAKD